VSALDGNWAVVEKVVSESSRQGHQGRRRLSAADVQQATRDSLRAIMMIRAYRMRGHLARQPRSAGHRAGRDPRSSTRRPTASPRPTSTGRSSSTTCSGLEFATIREMTGDPAAAPTAATSASSSCTSPTRGEGLAAGAHRGPDKEIAFTREGKKAILNKLIEAEGFEKFLDVKFTGTKRFGLDGGESLIPALEQIIKRGGALGVKDIVLGMAHRGRLNVLTQVMGKPHRAIFHEFKGGSFAPDDVEGSGDVKYHLGASSDREFDGNKSTCR
jgi:2-oxoglutarate dehydrogenase E1 component